MNLTTTEPKVMVSLDAAIEVVERYIPASLMGKRTQIKQALREIAAEPAEDYKALYMELLYQVHNVHPNESRHETAKRYIYEREHQPSRVTAA